MFSPGPNILAVIATSMERGRQAGKALALGVATGSVLWGVSTLFGLTALIALYASVMTVIKIAGAAYLLWLAYKAFRSASRRDAAPLHAEALDGGFWIYYRRGLTIQMSNPKAALSWIAIMSLVMGADTPVWVGALFVGSVAVLSMLGHMAYAVAFSTAGMVAGYRRGRRVIEACLGAFFCFASFKLLAART